MLYFFPLQFDILQPEQRTAFTPSWFWKTYLCRPTECTQCSNHQGKMAKVFKHHYMSLRLWHCLVKMLFYTVAFPYSLFLPPPTLYRHTHTDTKPLPCSPITSHSLVLHSVIIVCLCELFPLHNICKLCLRSWHCEEQKSTLQIIWAVNKEPALKCAEWPVWRQQYLQIVYCWDAVMSLKCSSLKIGAKWDLRHSVKHNL